MFLLLGGRSIARLQVSASSCNSLRVQLQRYLYENSAHLHRQVGKVKVFLTLDHSQQGQSTCMTFSLMKQTYLQYKQKYQSFCVQLYTATQFMLHIHFIKKVSCSCEFFQALFLNSLNQTKSSLTSEARWEIDIYKGSSYSPREFFQTQDVKLLFDQLLVGMYIKL